MAPKPKCTKKPAAIKKNVEPPKATSSGNSSGLSQDAEDQFELELCWCIQHLEMCLVTGKLSEKQALDLTKNINILKSNTAPLIKKRQVMRNTLGNYREKMTLDEQKFCTTTSSVKFTPSRDQNKKCTFLRKTATSTKERKLSTSDTLVNSDKNSTDIDNNSIDIDNVQTAFKFNFKIRE